MAFTVEVEPVPATVAAARGTLPLAEQVATDSYRASVDGAAGPVAATVVNAAFAAIRANPTAALRAFEPSQLQAFRAAAVSAASATASAQEAAGDPVVEPPEVPTLDG